MMVKGSGGARAADETKGGRSDRPLQILVEGAGEWAQEAYRALFHDKVKEGKRLSVYYADDTRWQRGGRPGWAVESLTDWETYLDKSNPEHFARYRQLCPDVVFVVTPDLTHSAIAVNWLERSAMVFVEKPFDSQLRPVDDLLRARGQLQYGATTRIYGLDHYLFYAMPLVTHKERIARHLDGPLQRVEFFLSEKEGINEERLRSLQHGLTLDLLPHCIALLSRFCLVSTLDEIEVLRASQYTPIDPRFQSETASHIRFSIRESGLARQRVSCEAVVGKGFDRGVKYLELTCASGRGLRIDFNGRAGLADGIEYPSDSVVFLLPSSEAHLGTTVRDPYQPSRTLAIKGGPDACPRLERARYAPLLEDLLTGTDSASHSLLSLSQARDIVKALDRIWWATRKAGWGERYPLGSLDPMAYANGSRCH